MKRFTKGLLAALLVITVVVSACAFTGVFSSAQALNEGVTVAFNGADNDWVTLSGTTIQDKALQAIVYNYSEDEIILSKIESNGTNIVYSGWTNNMPLASGSPYPIGISGTTTNNAVLTVTVTYYIKGNPTATAETCTTYIYCSSSQVYSSVSNEGTIDSGFGVYGLDTQTKISPALPQ